MRVQSKLRDVLVLAAILSQTGCPSSNHELKDDQALRNKMIASRTVVMALRVGAKLDAAKMDLGAGARHEFTVSTLDGAYTLVDCEFDGGNTLFLLFKNGELVKKIEAGAPFADIGRQDDAIAVQIKSDGMQDDVIRACIVTAIAAPAMTSEQVAAYLKPYVSSHSSHNNDIPAAIGKFLLLVTAHQIKKEDQATFDALHRYDGCRVQPGMTATDIEAIYGKPAKSRTAANGLAIWIYGSSAESSAHIKFAVVLDANQRVLAAYSNDFFPDAWMD